MRCAALFIPCHQTPGIHRRLPGLLAIGTLATGRIAGAVAGQNDGSRAPSKGGAVRARDLGRMDKGATAPHGFQGNNRCGYRNELAGDTSECILVNDQSGQLGPGFDHVRRAVALVALIRATMAYAGRADWRLPRP